MQKYVEPQKEIDVFCEADVIVVGGGPAGIGVSDLKRSTDFYMNVFGMKKLWKLKLPHMHEMILNLEGGRRSF